MELQIILPKGALGASDLDDELDTALREIAVKTNDIIDYSDWPSKYGVNFENDVFMMHEYCWCDQPDCPWCLACVCETEEECLEKCSNKEYAPNFHYKPWDFKVWWYKYIGRGVETNKTLTSEQIQEMLLHCLDSLKTQIVK